MKREDLELILKKHIKWLRSEDGGERANLSEANLYGANLSGANLSRANLYGANLSEANLYGANLSVANLYGANLSGADLSEANLYGANLSEADLYGANLYVANLYGANLSRANLYGADLYGANLSRANLYVADLNKIKNSKLILAMIKITPEGSFIGWKKCHNDVIVKLTIPEKAKRSNSTSRKCRAEYVKVLEIFGGDFGLSKYDGKTKYQKGKIVRCDRWEEDPLVECGGGIHFFLTREEAEAY